MSITNDNQAQTVSITLSSITFQTSNMNDQVSAELIYKSPTCFLGISMDFHSRISLWRASSHSFNLALSCSSNALRFSFCICSSSLFNNKIKKNYFVNHSAPVMSHSYLTVESQFARSSSSCFMCFVSKRCCSCI